MWIEKRNDDDSARFSSIEAAVERLTGAGAYNTPQARVPFDLQIH